MGTIWLTASYVGEQVRRRLRAVLRDNSERGALSLEWIVIAVALFVAATAAAVIFSKAVTSYTSQLP